MHSEKHISNSFKWCHNREQRPHSTISDYDSTEAAGGQMVKKTISVEICLHRLINIHINNTYILIIKYVWNHKMYLQIENMHTQIEKNIVLINKRCLRINKMYAWVNKTYRNL